MLLYICSQVISWLFPVEEVQDKHVVALYDASILLTVIRAWLARRQFEILQNLGESNIKLTEMETEVDVEFQETKVTYVGFLS